MARGARPDAVLRADRILVDGTYDLAGAVILIEAATLLVIASVYLFERRDV